MPMHVRDICRPAQLGDHVLDPACRVRRISRGTRPRTLSRPGSAGSLPAPCAAPLTRTPVLSKTTTIAAAHPAGFSVSRTSRGRLVAETPLRADRWAATSVRYGVGFSAMESVSGPPTEKRGSAARGALADAGFCACRAQFLYWRTSRVVASRSAAWYRCPSQPVERCRWATHSRALPSSLRRSSCARPGTSRRAQAIIRRNRGPSWWRDRACLRTAMGQRRCPQV